MSRLRVDVVTDVRDLDPLRAECDHLLARMPMASGFQSPGWIAACRAAVSDAGSRLLSLLVRDGAEVVGLLPTELDRHGRLRFVGDAVSNYCGPIYNPARADDFAAAFVDFLVSERSVGVLDLRGLREGSPFVEALGRQTLAGWSAPREVETATCPYLDLTPGWDAVYGRRKGKQRANFNRKWKALGRLGRLTYVEVADAAGAHARLPTLFELYARRWAGRHESGGFADRRRAFHERAIVALADAGRLRLSVLELDGRVIAFSYGVAGALGTTSYVLAHDDRLNVYSPGALLLLRVLEGACRRGDPEYDFSVGMESYKDQWATASRRVVRMLRWRRHTVAAVAARAYAAGARAWTAARSVAWLRDLRREGLRSLATAPAPIPDAPGLPAGEASSWLVYRVGRSAAAASARTWTYEEMSRSLSPRLLDIALDRCFRGDALLAVYRDARLLGLVWRASAARQAFVTGGLEVPAKIQVFYHPVVAESDLPTLLRAMPGVAGAPEAWVVSPRAVAGLAAPVHRFEGGHRIQGA